MNASASPFAASQLTNSYAQAASVSTVTLTRINEGNGDDGHTAHMLTSYGEDFSVVLLVVACTLLVVTVGLLIVGIRLLKRIAVAIAAAESARGQVVLGNDLSAEGSAAYVRVGVNDDNEAALQSDNCDNRTLLVENAHERQPLLHHVRGHGGGEGRRRTTLSVFGTLDIPPGVSSTPPIAYTGRHGETTSSRHQSSSYQTGSLAAPTLGSHSASGSSPQQQHRAELPDGFDAFAADEGKKRAFRPEPQSTWNSSGPLSKSGAPRKCDDAATAAASGSSDACAGTEKPTEMKAAASASTVDHGSTPLSGSAPPPLFTPTTEKDMVVYNTTHHSRYRLLQRIGMGAFSSVYLVQQKKTGRRYALKYILCKGDRERLAALRECEVMYSLQGHPQVIRIVDMFMNYQFVSVSASPTDAGCKKQAAGQQGSRPFSSVLPSVPAAAAAPAPSIIARLPPALTSAAQAMGSSTEFGPAAHSKDDNDQGDDMRAGKDKGSNGYRHDSRARARPYVEGVARGTCMINVGDASDVEKEESALHEPPAAVGKGSRQEKQWSPQQDTQSMRSSLGGYPRPPQHRVPCGSQRSGTVPPAVGAAASTPATLATSVGAKENRHVPLRPAHQSSTTVSTAASAAPVAGTCVFSPTRDEAHASHPHMCSHTTGNMPDAMPHNNNDATAPFNGSARCSTAHGTITTAATTHNAMGSRRGKAGHEPGTLEDCNDGDGGYTSNGSRRAAQRRTVAGKGRKSASQWRSVSSDGRGADGGDDGRADIEAGGEDERAVLCGDRDTDEKRSREISDAHSSSTSSSGADEEPIQPIHRIFVPPPYMQAPPNGTAIVPRSYSLCNNNIVCYAANGSGDTSMLQPQNPNYVAGVGSTTAPSLHSAFSTATAGRAPGVVWPAMANSSAAPTMVRSFSERSAVVSPPAPASPPACIDASASASSPSVALNVRHMAGSLVSTSALPPQQQPQPISSFVWSDAAVRAAVASTEVDRTVAGGAPPVHVPVRYNDFVWASTTVTAHAPAPRAPTAATPATGIVNGQAQRQPAIHPGSPALRSCAAAATAATREGSATAGDGAMGRTLERARGREPVPPPRTSYAPGGGVRYNSLIVPYVAAPIPWQAATKGMPVQSSSLSSSLTLSASGTGASAFDERKAGAGQGSRFEVTGADGSSYRSHTSTSGTHAARFIGSRSLPSTAPVVATAVRSTYAPLRYGHVVQSNTTPPVTPRTATVSLMSPPSPPLQKQLPQPLSAASPAAAVATAAPAMGGGCHSVSGALQGGCAGQQGTFVDWNSGKSRVSTWWPEDAALASRQAPPPHGLAGQTSGACFTRSVGPANSAGGVPYGVAPRASYGEEQPPASATTQEEVPSPTVPLYTNLGVLLAGSSMNVNSVPSKTTRVLRTGAQPPSPQHTQSSSHASGSADRKQQRGCGNGKSTGAAPLLVRYTNAGSPNLWTAYNGNFALAGAAPAVAVAAPTESSPRIGARAPTVGCAGASGTDDGKSRSSSSSPMHDACDSGYVCLVMEHHPMGDLCLYALRAKRALENLRHRQQHSQSQTLASSTVVSMGIPQSITSPATSTTQASAKNTTEHDGGSAETDAGKPCSLLSPRPLSSTYSGAGGRSAAVASSLLAAAAAATWTVRVAMSRADLHPTLSAGVRRHGNTFGCHTASGADGGEDTRDLDVQPKASVAVDPTLHNPFTEAQLLSIAYQLASVLDHMHQQNPPIVHRDLKPENILIKGELIDYLDLPLSEVLASTTSTPSSPSSHADTAAASSRRRASGRSTVRSSGNDNALGKSPMSPKPSLFTTPAAVIDAATNSLASLPPIRITRAVVPIVLIDFGLAIVQDTQGRPHGSRGGGTRPYMAPESWKGGTCTASDVWSLGCVLYALATCRLVAEDVRIMSEEAKRDGFASRVLNDLLAKKYSVAFASFVVSLLVVEPEKRPTAAQAARCFCVADGEICFDLSSPFFSNVLDL